MKTMLGEPPGLSRRSSAALAPAPASPMSTKTENAVWYPGDVTGLRMGGSSTGAHSLGVKVWCHSTGPGLVEQTISAAARARESVLSPGGAASYSLGRQSQV